jgi:hypothetical protein
MPKRTLHEVAHELACLRGTVYILAAWADTRNRDDVDLKQLLEYLTEALRQVVDGNELPIPPRYVSGYTGPETKTGSLVPRLPNRPTRRSG